MNKPAASLLIAVTLAALPRAGGADPRLNEPHLALRPLAPDQAARAEAILASGPETGQAEAFEANSGGVATTQGQSFRDILPGLSDEARMQATLGEALFDKLWVAAPSTTRASDGLGPVFNARSCAGCHPGGGRGRPEPEGISGLVARLSNPTAAGAPDPDLVALGAWHPIGGDPVFGRQLNTRALPELPPEGQLSIDWIEEKVSLSGGEVAHLRRPRARVKDAGQGALAPETRVDLRVAPQMIGLGLLEAIPAAAILEQADPEDADGDGISGRAAVAPSRQHGQPMLGRFGHKAQVATLADMSASALFHDLGLSSPLYPQPEGDCASAACAALPDGEDAGLRDGREVSAEAVAALTRYAGALAVPARRAVDDPQVLAGKAAFHDAGCAACHRPKQLTHQLVDDPARSFQLIWPYTDLLLHDMGPELAAAAPEGAASASEWRTPPLWGIGLSAQVTGPPATYLHDGRARSLLEATLWHGGEAEAARDRVAAMAREARAALIRFLESL
ncbi:di-heme oxidoredictase family protein [Pseudothioclava arenosa]|uniref:Thiol oxidoreductase n=1 Tax=Pseudothioclava arenosa TaxID=1795308 RepID=A0A2A4CUU9_9RHOB|nr:di-heme oxidoredictase family protein [Pseudothioclava arenosa]PCD78120.1 thiol oxidoreductase [Pseudothioclava arenosa]